MPTALIDLTRLKKLHCGLGQFALHLGRTIQSLASPQLRTDFLVPRAARRLLESASPFSTLHTAVWWQREAPRRTLRPMLQFVPSAPRADVWHTIDHLSTYGPCNRRTPVVLTIHDLNFPTERTAAQNRHSLDLLQRRIDRATLLTTGSHFAARQIREHLDLGGKELRVIYHGLCVRAPTSFPSSGWGTDSSSSGGSASERAGDSPGVAPEATRCEAELRGEWGPQLELGNEVRPSFAPTRPFLFSIGEFRPYKNFHTLIGLLRALPGDRQLVIAGNHATPYAEKVQAEIARCRLADRVVLPGIVSDDQRHWLYEHCDAFVFPSLAEGFGLPAIEAMSFGKPVFLAEATSLPEVGGPLAFYWNDYAPEAMATVFERGWQTFQQTPGYAERVRQHAAQFTWPSAARNYLELYADVVHNVTASTIQYGAATRSGADDARSRRKAAS